MIRNRQSKINCIVSKIRNGIEEINERYRKGPDLYFYRRLLARRKQAQDLPSFLQDDYNIELLYATLVAWDMNSRGAKMLYFDYFRGNILSCLDQLRQLESLLVSNQNQRNDILQVLRTLYDNLTLMMSGGRLVSNSKLLHFLFPDKLTPMDRTNTLQYFYNNTGESSNKFIEITNVAFDIMGMEENWAAHLDQMWNVSVPKMIDNAVLLIEGRSLN